MTKVSGLRGLILKTAQIDKSTEFFGNLWGLKRIESASDDRVFFVGSGSEPCVLGLVEADARGIDTARFALKTEAEVDNAYADLGSRGITLLDEPGRLALPGDYYGFHLQDPDGNRVELSAISGPSKEEDSTLYAPERMSHFVFNSPDNVALRDFYVENLGFELADWYEPDLFFFMKGNQEHHCLGIEKCDNSSLNHVAFQVADLDAMMRCVSKMHLQGIEPLWGPGRHGPGGNCFCYFESPDGYVVEYTSELIQTPEGTEWAPKAWKPGPDNANVWGTGGRDKRTVKLMSGH